MRLRYTLPPATPSFDTREGAGRLRGRANKPGRWAGSLIMILWVAASDIMAAAWSVEHEGAIVAVAVAMSCIGNSLVKAKPNRSTASSPLPTVDAHTQSDREWGRERETGATSVEQRFKTARRAVARRGADGGVASRSRHFLAQSTSMAKEFSM